MFEIFKKENLFKTIVAEIRNSLDIEITKQKIVEIIGKTLKADRCFIIDYDKDSDSFLIVKNEYLSSQNIPKYSGADVNKDVPNFMEELKKGNYLVIDKKKIFINDEPQEYKIEKDTIEKVNVYSAYGIPIFYKGELYSALGLHYINKKHQAKKDEIKLLLSISDQIALAIYQAKLYKKIKEQAEREKLLREIIETIRSTSDITKIKQKVITEIANTLNANRCYIAEFDHNEGKHMPIKQEYLATTDIKSIIGFDVEKNIPELVKFVKDKPLVLIPNVDKFLVENNFSETINNYFKEFNVESRIYAQILYREEFFGTLVVNFPSKKNKFKQADIEFIETLAKQVGIIIHQERLYEQIKKQAQNEKKNAEREKLLRNIFAKALITFDLNQMKQIVSDIGKLAKADRCYFVEVKEAELSGKEIYYEGEYLTSPSIKSSKGYTFPKEEVHKFVELFLNTKDLIVFDYEKILETTDKEFEGMRIYAKRFDLKSGVGIPLFYENKLHAVLAIEYIKEKIIPTEDELKFYRLLGRQTAMILNQIKLFEKTKNNALREALIRNITEKIRSSLDINEILIFICEETAKMFNVQRSAIMFTNEDGNYDNSSIKAEYVTSPDIKGYTDMVDFQIIANYWKEMFTNTGQIIAFDNIEDERTPFELQTNYIKMGIKSIMGIFIKLKKNSFGILTLSEFNQYRNWTDEEKILLQNIGNQIYIAINQAKLYEEQKNMAERERISRNIIEILRSSLDKQIIKRLFVKNIGKFFDADRVFFSEYDNNAKIFSPVDQESEYLSSFCEKSIIGYDWSNPGIEAHISPLLDKREIRIPNSNEYIQQCHNTNKEFLKLYEQAAIKSSYNFPVLYQNNLIGYFSIEFAKRTCELSEEDLGRIRSICTQSGIALHYAILYERAQQCFKEKNLIAFEIIEQIKNPTTEILNKAQNMAQKQIERTAQLEYLNTIINACNQLLELTKSFSKE